MGESLVCMLRWELETPVDVAGDRPGRRATCLEEGGVSSKANEFAGNPCVIVEGGGMVAGGGPGGAPGDRRGGKDFRYPIVSWSCCSITGVLVVGEGWQVSVGNDGGGIFLVGGIRRQEL